MWITNWFYSGYSSLHYRACTSSAVFCSVANMQFMCHRGGIVGRKETSFLQNGVQFISFLHLFPLLLLLFCFHVAPLLHSISYKHPFHTSCCWQPLVNLFAPVAFCWEYDMDLDSANSLISVKFYHFNVYFMLISYITSKEKHIWSPVVATKHLPKSKFGPSCFRITKYSIPVLPLFWSCHSREEPGGDWKIW